MEGRYSIHFVLDNDKNQPTLWELHEKTQITATRIDGIEPSTSTTQHSWRYVEFSKVASFPRTDVCPQTFAHLLFTPSTFPLPHISTSCTLVDL